MKGIFITFEGGEASGKTTVIKCLVEALKTAENDIVQTREPGGIEISEEIRSIILNVKNTRMTAQTEALLYAASRMQHLSERIIPALESGKIVICDRYLDSSLVYQGYARGLGIENVLKVNYFALDYLPDITFFFDIKPEVALKRLNNRQSEINRLDLEELSFHQKVYEGYLELMKKYPKRIIRINANRDVNLIAEDVIKKVLAIVKK